MAERSNRPSTQPHPHVVRAMMKAVRTSETPVYSNVTARRYIWEDSKRHTRRLESLKSHIILFEILLRLMLQKNYSVPEAVFSVIRWNRTTWSQGTEISFFKWIRWHVDFKLIRYPYVRRRGTYSAWNTSLLCRYTEYYRLTIYKSSYTELYKPEW
jgi:hypothetical protein